MRIGIDIDDTLFDFVSVWIGEYNKEHDDQLTLADITDWVFSGVDFKCSKAEFYNYLHNAYLQLRAEAFPGVRESLAELADMGHLACFITATRRSVAPTKINKLLMELDPDLDYELHFTREKWHVNCEVYIDDNPRDIEGYKEHTWGKPWHNLLLLFDRPWNRHVETHTADWFIMEVRRRRNKGWMIPDRMAVTKLPIRVTSWQEIVQVIDWYEMVGKEHREARRGYNNNVILGIDWALVGAGTTALKDMDEGEDCHGCVLEYECSLSPDVCGGPYEEVVH